MPEHVHISIAVPPNLPDLQVVGDIKTKSAIHLPQMYRERKRSGVPGTVSVTL